MTANDDPVPALHDKEDGSNDRSVVAQVKSFGCGGEERMHGLEHHVLASHVMRLGGDRAERAAAKHVFARRRAQKIREIRVAARELFNGQIFGAVYLAAEIERQS